MAYLSDSLLRGSRQGLSLLSPKQVGNLTGLNTSEVSQPHSSFNFQKTFQKTFHKTFQTLSENDFPGVSE